jgi:hypothetical protein
MCGPPLAVMTLSRHHRRTMLVLTWGGTIDVRPGDSRGSIVGLCRTTGGVAPRPLRPSLIATTPPNHSFGLCADCRGCPMTLTKAGAKDTHRRTLNVVGSRYKRVEHWVRGPSVRSGAAERPKSTVGVDLHMCFAVDHLQDQPVRPDYERGALDRSDQRETAWGDPVRAGH